jgi:excisionase family DNA binding protein
MSDIQTIADALKAWIDLQPADSRIDKAARRRALDAVSQFERAENYPGAWMEVMKRHLNHFTMINSVIVPRHDTTFDHVADLVTDYVQHVAANTARPTTGHDDQQMFSTAQAADYLGVSVPTMKKYTHVDKIITGTMIGNSLAFSRADLDAIKPQVRHSRGRPPAKARPATRPNRTRT